MTKAKLVILRHGQTEFNNQHLMTGKKDVPLTAKGEDQGRAAGKLISHIRFDKAYSSTLSRAFNTAALALESSGTQKHLQNTDGSWQIEQRVEIIELDTGHFTGRCHSKDPEIIAFKRGYDIPLPGGESMKDVVARVQAFFDAEIMPRLMKGENVLVVAHAGVLRAFDYVLGLDTAAAATPTSTTPGFRKKIPNATPTVYDYEDGVMTDLTPLINEAANENAPPAPKKKIGPNG